MTNKLLEKVTRINANNEKYGDVSFTASDVIEIARNLSVAVIMSIDEKNREQISAVTAYSTILMETILQIAQAKKESEEER